MTASPVPRQFSPVPHNSLKTLSLTGCLVGCSPVRAVVCKPLKTLGSSVLAGPLSRTPHTPYSPIGHALGRAPGSLAGEQGEPDEPQEEKPPSSRKGES
jgi:hypothetical protein